jgi:hypothetical protein
MLGGRKNPKIRSPKDAKHVLSAVEGDSKFREMTERKKL